MENLSEIREEIIYNPPPPLAHRNRSDFCDLRLRCPPRTPEIARFPRQEKAMLHCDSRVRWKVASDLRFRAAISKRKTPSFCGISGDLAPSTRKSLAIAIVRFWCAKPPSPHFLPKGIFQGRGGAVYILSPHAAGILYPPPFTRPPPLEIKFGPVRNTLSTDQRPSPTRSLPVFEK